MEVLLDVRGLQLPGQQPEGTLKDPFVGPLRVKEVVAGNAYRLEMPTRWRVHDVVNAERLQHYLRDTTEQGAEIQPGSVLSERETQHEEFELDHIGHGHHMGPSYVD